MRTNAKKDILNKLIDLITNTSKYNIFEYLNKKDEIEIYNYIEKEFINYEELKELLSSLKYDKSELIKLLYELIILCLNNENIILKNTKYLSKKASSAGFDWSDNKTCFKKVQEEILELKEALKNNDKDNIKEELGDVLFTLNSFARLSNINLMDSLDLANTKFKKRYSVLSEIVKEEKLDMKSLSNNKKEKLWIKAKGKIKN